MQCSSLPDAISAVDYVTNRVFCCVGALAITGSLHHIDNDLLGWWLCEQQVKSGGLNGRPKKLPDVCYSWWVLSSLIMIDRVQWIHKEKLVKFILDCQDKEMGGISDRPDDVVDVFHAYFEVAGEDLLAPFFRRTLKQDLQLLVLKTLMGLLSIE